MSETTHEVRRGLEYTQAVEERPLGRPTQSGESATEDGSDPVEVRSHIAQTRADMSGAIGALQEKLDPSHIAEQAKDQLLEKVTDAYGTSETAVKDATLRKATKIVASVTEAESSMTKGAGSTWTDNGSGAVRYIRENAIPVALVGIGLGMLAFNKRRRQEGSYHSARTLPYEPHVPSRSDQVSTGGIGNTVQSVAGTLTESARQQLGTISDQARQKGRIASDHFQTTLQTNPLLLGVIALAAGAIFGLSIPKTRLEDEYLSDVRDRLVDQAKSLAQDTADKVQRVTQEVGRTVGEAAQKEGLTT